MGRDALGVGFLGYGWISRAHAHALHTLNHLAPLGKETRLVSIAGRRREPLEAAARELGFRRWTTSWEELLDDRMSTSSQASPPSRATPSRRSRRCAAASRSSARSRWA